MNVTTDETRISEHHPTLYTSPISGRVDCACGWSERVRAKKGNAAQAASVAWALHVMEEIRRTN